MRHFPSTMRHIPAVGFTTFSADCDISRRQCDIFRRLRRFPAMRHFPALHWVRVFIVFVVKIYIPYISCKNNIEILFMTRVFWHKTSYLLSLISSDVHFVWPALLCWAKMTSSFTSAHMNIMNYESCIYFLYGTLYMYTAKMSFVVYKYMYIVYTSPFLTQCHVSVMCFCCN